MRKGKLIISICLLAVFCAGAVQAGDLGIGVKVVTGSHSIQVTNLTLTIPFVGTVAMSPLPPAKGPNDSSTVTYSLAQYGYNPTGASVSFLMDGVPHSGSYSPLRYDTLYTLPFHGLPDSKISFHLCSLRGDVNNDFYTDISDIVASIQYVVFGTALPDLTAGDVNGDGVVDITDIVGLVQYVVFGGPVPICL